ncbi:hypothetical protein MAFF241648_21630 [Ralstonia solanacearum]|nr:hypothetical protein MAFF241648_21630 [Ralstonia solanacearum]
MKNKEEILRGQMMKAFQTVKKQILEGKTPTIKSIHEESGIPVKSLYRYKFLSKFVHDKRKKPEQNHHYANLASRYLVDVVIYNKVYDGQRVAGFVVIKNKENQREVARHAFASGNYSKKIWREKLPTAVPNTSADIALQCLESAYCR